MIPGAPVEAPVSSGDSKCISVKALVTKSHFLLYELLHVTLKV